MTDHAGAPIESELTERDLEIYTLRFVKRWTLQRIADQYEISFQRVSQILERIRKQLPPVDIEAVRQQAIALHMEVQRQALELADLPGTPVTAGKDGTVVTDPAGGEVVRDYAGRISALKLALEADREIRKLCGADAATKVEQSGEVRYELVGINLSDLT